MLTCAVTSDPSPRAEIDTAVAVAPTDEWPLRTRLETTLEVQQHIPARAATIRAIYLLVEPNETPENSNPLRAPQF